MDVSVIVAGLALVCIGLLALVVASSERGQGIKLPAGIEITLDADSATPKMRIVIASTGVVILVFGGFLMARAADIL